MFGLKNDEILTYFLLIVVGYCIAKMFSRSCEGVEGVSPSPSPQVEDTCKRKLDSLCGHTVDYQPCSMCAGNNQENLRKANCSENVISKYCIHPMPNEPGYTINILDIEIKDNIIMQTDGKKIYNYLNQLYENIINAHPSIISSSNESYTVLQNNFIKEVGFSFNNNYTILNYIKDIKDIKGTIVLQKVKEPYFQTFFQIMKGNSKDPKEENDIRFTIQLMNETNYDYETLYLHLNDSGNIITQGVPNIKNFRIYYYFKNN